MEHDPEKRRSGIVRYIRPCPGPAVQKARKGSGPFREIAVPDPRSVVEGHEQPPVPIPRMSPTVRIFLKSSLAWLALGVTFGVAMAAHPVWSLYRLAHVHMLLLGFVAMMIFGVAYHVIPNFAGFPLHRPVGARVHWWLANIGLAAMASGFVLRVHAPSAGTILLAAGGTLSAAGAYLFVYLIWRTIDGPANLRAGAERARQVMDGRRAGRRPLPLATSSRGTPPAA